MAAAQLDTTTADEFADALDEHLDSLRSPRRQVPARHRSLSDLLAWSEARLDEREARTLAELSVFAGPVIAGDIDGVLDDPGVADVVRVAGHSIARERRSRPHTDALLSAANRSLLRRPPARRLRTCRRDGAPPCAVVHRHRQRRGHPVAHRRGRTRATHASPRSSPSFERRTAGRHGTTSSSQPNWRRTSISTRRAASSTSRSSGVSSSSTGSPADDRRRPILLASAAWRALRRGDIAQARRHASEAVRCAGDRPAAMPALDVLTDAGLFDGHVEESATSSRTLSELARRDGDLLYLALGHSGAALSAAYGGVAGSAQRGRAEQCRRACAPAVRSGVARLHARRALPAARSTPRPWPTSATPSPTPARSTTATSKAPPSCRTARCRPASATSTRRSDAFAEAVRHWLRAANTTQQVTTLRNLAVLFQRVDSAEALADLLGTVDRGDVPTYGDEADRLTTPVPGRPPHSERRGSRSSTGPERPET